MWQVADLDAAIALAEQKATAYAAIIESEYLGRAQAYWLPEHPGHGSEVFSLYRDSELAPADYINRFFDAGTERQRHSGDP